ncbi:hypothetical protein COCNU_03G015360 [Cocos nucifera]|uniref:Ubiquitin-like domain-containing protein n=1 Tax=Cocos nucifera TaxID=13894 RepID=A0A8K0I3Y5_COCNU|nr:hypothetical protein COCNU_03G015360 [Cocos nucifera]
MSNDKHQDSINLSDLGSTLPTNTPAMSAEDRAGLVDALKNKLQSLAGKQSDVLETLSPKVRKRVEVLREIQGQHDELEAKFFEERAALEAKYQKLYEPLYTKRYDIVNGLVEVEGVTNEPVEENPTEDKASEEKGVPNFWLTAMKTNEVLAEEIQERDEGALKYLKDIKWSRIDNPKGFKLEFFFDPNPYFKNSILRKTYHMIDEEEPILEKAIGTQVEWLPGKCLTQKLLKKKPKKGSKNAKPITKTEDCESFFNFFSPPQVPDDDEDIDEDTAEQLQNQMEQDYDIGEVEGKVNKWIGQLNASSSKRFMNEMADAAKSNSNGATESSQSGAERAIEAHEFTVYLRLWTSHKLELEVTGSTSINDIKEAMSDVDGTPKDRQILKFGEHELEDHQTLEHYNIKNGSCLDQRVKRYKLDIVR